jgi:hypothetical protein
LGKLSLIGSVGVSFAFVAVLKFYGALKKHIAHQRPLAKLVAFKIVVGLTFIEQVSHISEL